jgi:glycerophosphoryl diester phosphodiesterase
MRRRTRALVFTLLFLTAASGAGQEPIRRFGILAHRGVHVNWKQGTYETASGCEAANIYPPAHDYLENTVRSIGAAFAMGASIVEIDMRRTADGALVAMHDSDLSCRTDGHGRVEDAALAYLKGLDLGYGYTADGGVTFPLRGKGVGMLPTLTEVFNAFPGASFLVDHKDGQRDTADLFIALLRTLPETQQSQVFYWGPDDCYEAVRQATPVRWFLVTRKQMMDWFLSYVLTLGLSGFPKEAEDIVIAMPVQYLWLAWGYPDLLLERVHAAAPVDGIITDYIETVGRFFPKR